MDHIQNCMSINIGDVENVFEEQEISIPIVQTILLHILINIRLIVLKLKFLKQTNKSKKNNLLTLNI